MGLCCPIPLTGHPSDSLLQRVWERSAPSVQTHFWPEWTFVDGLWLRSLKWEIFTFPGPLGKSFSWLLDGKEEEQSCGNGGTVEVYEESTLGKVNITESWEETQKEGEFLFTGARLPLKFDLTLNFPNAWTKVSPPFPFEMNFLSAAIKRKWLMNFPHSM